jgi:uracil-DNA glycosylase
MSVEKDKPLSHKDKGWEIFTDNIIKYLNKREKPVIFVLWGSFARSKKELIDLDKHYVIESAHPSPLSASRGFFGSRPFSKINDILSKTNQDIIKW